MYSNRQLRLQRTQHLNYSTVRDDNYRRTGFCRIAFFFSKTIERGLEKTRAHRFPRTTSAAID